MKKITWLDIEDFVKMMPIGKTMKTDLMNKIVKDFNSGKITLDQVKEEIRNAKSVSMAEFLNK